METKVLKKYPFQVFMMTATFLIMMTLPILMSYLIDNILGSDDMNALIRWFAITFGLSAVGILFKFYFCEYTPRETGHQKHIPPAGKIGFGHPQDEPVTVCAEGQRILLQCLLQQLCFLRRPARRDPSENDQLSALYF